MNTPFFIAKRYLFSKKSQNVINIISSISVVGITISTAAMVIVLSAFNGIEGLVLNLFNSFESDIKIEASHSKTFNKSFINQTLFDDDELINYSEIIEETVIIKNQEQFTFGTIKGVQNSFLDIVKMDDYILDGKSTLGNSEQPFGLVGVGALQNLNGYIYQINGQYDYFTVYSPNRNEKIKRNSTSAFEMSRIPIVGTFSFNNKIDASYLIVPIDYAAKVLGYDNDITAIELDYGNGIDLQKKKQKLQTLIGDDFTIKTSFEQNELMFKTSQSERLMTTILLGFIFFLGTLNMVASMAMLVIEKKKNLTTLVAMGAETHQLEKIFFYVGLLINGSGLIFGLVLGYIISFLQIKFGILKMEGGMIEFFPMKLLWSDLLMILIITTVIGTLAAYIPSKLLIKKMV